MKLEEVLDQLRQLGDSSSLPGMARYGIVVDKALGIRMPVLRALAKSIKKDHALALELWSTGIHEARLLAIFVADKKQVTEDLMEAWVRDFNSWDICDQACSGLLDKSLRAYEKASEWTARTGEFEKRAGFVMMACLTVHDKKAPDEKFIRFLPLIEQHAGDERNFVKKAVNWALRQIGKRNKNLNRLAIESALRIQRQNSKSARWIASDALRELYKHQERFILE